MSYIYKNLSPTLVHQKFHCQNYKLISFYHKYKKTCSSLVVLSILLCLVFDFVINFRAWCTLLGAKYSFVEGIVVLWFVSCSTFFGVFSTSVGAVLILICSTLSGDFSTLLLLEATFLKFCLRDYIFFFYWGCWLTTYYL